MFILQDPDKCTGCFICEFVCLKNFKGKAKAIKVFSFFKKGINFPVIKPFSIVGEESNLVDCNLCENKFLCVRACPFKALEIVGEDAMGFFKLRRRKEKIEKIIASIKEYEKNIKV